MNKKELKPTANIVGVAPLGDPHFEEHTPTSPTAYTNSKSKIKTLTSDNKGITLIALVITIIVMLILVAVTVTVAINGGLFTTAKQATTDTQYHADREMLLSAVIGAINNDAEVDFTELDANLPQDFTGTEGEYTSEAGNTFYVDSNGNITDEKVGPSGLQVTVDGKVDGETVTLTPDNVADYLGRVVTNYAGKDSVNGYTVSTTYRLYYVDFKNKYGDGEGTVYLKADCTNNNYQLKTDTTESTEPNIKIKNLNPGLYNEEDENGLPIVGSPQTPPSSENENMQAVTWLTNTNNWSDLKPETFSDGITEQDVNYIVGAPSLEMMMDSYNTHYKKDIKDFSGPPDISDINPGERRKLFYQYDSGWDGYEVGPGPDGHGGYDYYTSVNSVYTDEKIDSMYYPGEDNSYWVASPNPDDPGYVYSLDSSSGGYISWEQCDWDNAFCPLVSLKSLVNLKLQ